MAEVFPITIKKFFTLWLGCLALVFLTYNPFGHSFYHWITDPSKDYFPAKLMVGLLLLFAYGFLIRVMRSTLQRTGFATGILLLALTINEALELMAKASPVLRRFAVVFCIGTLLAVGLTWPHIRVNFSGAINKRYLIPKPKYRKYWHWIYWR